MHVCLCSVISVSDSNILLQNLSDTSHKGLEFQVSSFLCFQERTSMCKFMQQFCIEMSWKEAT